MRPVDRLGNAYVRVRQLVDLWAECPSPLPHIKLARTHQLNLAAKELAEALTEMVEQ